MTNRRLSALDASFLYTEESTLPMHVGSVMIFEPPKEGFTYDQLVALISERIADLPRYRQRIRYVPGRLADPVWVDDQTFDLSYHVRRSALPAPGGDAQLEEFVARITSRALDRDRPLWEVYLVEGLQRGRFAIVTKAHQSMVDGINAVDIAHLLVDADAAEQIRANSPWRPQGEPSDLRLVVDAVADAVRSPGHAVEHLRHGLRDVSEAGQRVLSLAGGLAATLARVGARPAPTSPLNATIGRARRWVLVSTDLADYRTVRSRLARGRYVEDVTIHDVVLATITGALRTWMQMRGEPVTATTTVRAMVPISVYDESGEHFSGARMTAAFVDLPVGEPNPSMRLHQIAFAMRQQMETDRAVDAASLASLGGFAPPTLHSLGARAGGAMTRRLSNLVITNVPGPQQALYAGGAKMLATYPVMPLGRGQALAIGLTSYDGGVYFGLNGDRDAMADLDGLAHALEESLSELLQSHRSSGGRKKGSS
ncbi:wax ester/triacylglycerol synthase family O-acyltransferase [Janibacter sp. GXQ6167]|uniref:WS/DGAT/MGAT family O-acyltransferase n=1 Tax=Janibacter sp. GXQ6167 TaxID=3240791 RepID=UPI003525C3B4